jgi:hypothetical protein
MRIWILFVTFMRIQALLHADPDPTFHYDADPDPDPSFQINGQSLEIVLK